MRSIGASRASRAKRAVLFAALPVGACFIKVGHGAPPKGRGRRYGKTSHTYTKADPKRALHLVTGELHRVAAATIVKIRACPMGRRDPLAEKVPRRP